MCFKDARKDLVEIGMKLASQDEEYPEDFLIHFADIIQQKQLDVEYVKGLLPAAKLVSDDFSSLLKFEKKTRCFFGCNPLSYQYFERYLEDQTLDGLLERPYYTAYDSKLDATFTKTEFIQSIEKRKKEKVQVKRLIKK